MIEVGAAHKQDASALAELLAESGQKSLNTLFDINHSELLGFLRYSLARAEGQFGYANHSAAYVDGKLTGIITAWHGALPDNFQQDTIKSINEYFGPAKTLETIDRSLTLASMLPPPQTDEFCIGHLSVQAAWRRKGIASALVDKMLQHAKQLKLSKAILDVQVDNLTATAFYQSKGFELVRKLQSETAQQAGFAAHLRLQKHL